MTGLNHVSRGGSPLVSPLSGSVTMTKVSVGPMDNNGYLLQTRSGAAVLIDAANDAGRLIALVADQPLDAIVTTHRHGDHWQGLAAVAAATDARLVCGAPDLEAIASGAGVVGLVAVWDGDKVELGEESLEVIGLVGHTPGSITLAYRGDQGVSHLFTGDSLFPGGAGRTAGPAEFGSLMDDLEAKVFGRFGDDTVVHPGHGDDTTLGAERPHLGEWRSRGW
jgi:glyoxylase-like metal-dependent hydrolase (beta-lactamase superfamily II)